MSIASTMARALDGRTRLAAVHQRTAAATALATSPRTSSPVRNLRRTGTPDGGDVAHAAHTRRAPSPLRSPDGTRAAVAGATPGARFGRFQQHVEAAESAHEDQLAMDDVAVADVMAAVAAELRGGGAVLATNYPTGSTFDAAQYEQLLSWTWSFVERAPEVFVVALKMHGGLSDADARALHADIAAVVGGVLGGQLSWNVIGALCPHGEDAIIDAIAACSAGSVQWTPKATSVWRCVLVHLRPFGSAM